MGIRCRHSQKGILPLRRPLTAFTRHRAWFCTGHQTLPALGQFDSAGTKQGTMRFHGDVVNGLPAYNSGHNAISAVVHHLLTLPPHSRSIPIVLWAGPLTSTPRAWPCSWPPFLLHRSPDSVTIHTAIICSESSIARTWARTKKAPCADVHFRPRSGGR